jgi:membrane protease YdiL (CAAX protease family)
VYANNTIYQVLSEQPHASPVNDLLSDAVFLFVAFMPAVLLPGFFGYRLGSMAQHWKLFLGMAIFFTVTPLLYRLLAGETPFGANTWFFEGVVVPLAEEGVFRGVLLSVLLWGFSKIYSPRTAALLTLILSTLIFASSHLNNGHYPTSFILFR